MSVGRVLGWSPSIRRCGMVCSLVHDTGAERVRLDLEVCVYVGPVCGLGSCGSPDCKPMLSDVHVVSGFAIRHVFVDRPCAPPNCGAVCV